MIKMEKQTVVEWLIDMLDIDINDSTTKDIIKQARAMEKEQHQQTAIHFFPTSLKKVDFEQYYNETYEK
jgi:uncharacterized protein (UPF0210 family)